MLTITFSPFSIHSSIAKGDLMCSVKESYKLFWMVKGHLNANHKTIMESADGYFERLWGNHESCYREKGFEDAWEKIKW